MWDTAATERLLVGTVLLPLQQFQCQSLHHSSLWGEYPACSQCSTMALREASSKALLQSLGAHSANLRA